MLGFQDFTFQLAEIDLVWGGVCIHSLIGKEHAGSMSGRNHVLGAVKQLGLNVTTSTLWHLCYIDSEFL